MEQNNSDATEYKICTRCVMDTKGDPTITFDENGVCSYCTEAVKKIESSYFPNAKGDKKLSVLLDTLKKSGEGKKYDCLMGISGGLDSAYLAYLGAKKWGLRILAVHIDDGFDTEISRRNIKNLCESCGIELHIITPDKEQFCQLTKAYIKAGVPNLAVPQDNILFAEIFDFAQKNDIKYFLSGHNISLESILQAGNTHHASDVKNIKDIASKFSSGKIDKLRFISTFFWRFYLPRIKGLQQVTPLNYIDYNRKMAIDELIASANFEYYGAKHEENVFTKVFQNYYLYHKFGVDKRKSHLSSLIISGQMSRQDALLELENPPYDDIRIKNDIQLVCNTLDLSVEEFEEICHTKGRQHTDFKTELLPNIYRRLKKLS